MTLDAATVRLRRAITLAESTGRRLVNATSAGWPRG